MHSLKGIRRFPEGLMFVASTDSSGELAMSTPRSAVEQCGQPRRLVLGDVGRLPAEPTVKPQCPRSREV